MVNTKFIAIANLKGGAGKTTLVSWLGYALRLLGRSVVLVDLDPQAHLTSVWIRDEPLIIFGNSYMGG